MLERLFLPSSLHPTILYSVSPISCTSQYSNANVSFLGDYEAYHAVDGRLSPENSEFFHSDLEVDPWLRIQLKLPDNSDFEPQDIPVVVMYQRCDANELCHQTAFETKWPEYPNDKTRRIEYQE